MIPSTRIDHVMVRSGPLGPAMAAYRRLGFVVRAPRHHEGLGGAGDGGSAVVSFGARGPTTANYLELSHADPAHAPAAWCAHLDGTGIALLMHSTDDLPTVADSWRRRTGSHLLDFDLPMPGTDGIADQVIHGALMLDGGGGPVPIGVCSYEHTAEYDQTSLTAHPNGALGMSAVHVVTTRDRIDPDAAILGGFHGDPERGDRSAWQWRCGDVDLHLYDGAGFLERFGEAAPEGRGGHAVSIAVVDLEATEELLSRSAVDHRRVDADALVVGPADASGLVLEFVARPPASTMAVQW